MILKIIYALFFTSLISIKTNCQETTGDFIIEFVRDSSEENVYWIKNKKFNGEIAKKMIDESGLKVMSAIELKEAAEQVGKALGI